MAGMGRFAREAARTLGVEVERAVAERLDAATGDRGAWPWASAFPVAELALDSVGLVSALIDAVAEQRGASPGELSRIDTARVAASFGSERLLRVDGTAPAVWAPLSGFFRAADGWVRTHGNYPHHAARLRAVLGLGASGDAASVAAAVAARSRFELEDAAAAGGAIVAAVRDVGEWQQHPHLPAVSATPLVGITDLAPSAARPWRGGGAPLAGVRVLDLTRVIAGPVATRDLALAGADVLRIDDPHRPEIAWQHLDTGQHKRTTSMDLSDAGDRRILDELLRTADVVVTGYRPGALDRFGLAPERLGRAHPGIVVATLSAWGSRGEWAGRRGFDSIVQAATGIAVTEGETRGTDGPGALPVQALDHASGHFFAAGIVAALLRQRAEGGSLHVSVVLARTALSLLRGRTALGGDTGRAVVPADAVEVPVRGGGTLTCAPPLLGFAGAPRAYGWVHPWGTDSGRWADTGRIPG